GTRREGRRLKPRGRPCKWVDACRAFGGVILHAFASAATVHTASVVADASRWTQTLLQLYGMAVVVGDGKLKFPAVCREPFRDFVRPLNRHAKGRLQKFLDHQRLHFVG